MTSSISHCIDKKESCKKDSAAFHLTKLTKALKHPNRPDEDNHYALGIDEPDLQQCRVVVNTHGYETKATVYNPAGDQANSASGRLDKDDSSLEIKGTDEGADAPALPSSLYIYRNAGDDWDRKLGFNYGKRDFAQSMEDIASGALGGFRYFLWQADVGGSSTQIDSEGHYCTVDTQKASEVVTVCWFPCVIPD